MIENVTRDRIRGEREPDIIRGAKNNDLDEVQEAYALNRDKLNLSEHATGFTALQYAVARGNLSIVQFLLEQEDIDIQLADNHERTALELAVEVGHQGIISALLRARAARVS